ncbi:MAG TPA: AEC family transporter [Devosia sp.]|jgi:predicted permease|nr:AEC family transporter [Devosia sp.]
MLDLFNVILPVFAIIGLGYLAVRFRLFPADGTRALVAFVNNFATPCLLCLAMLTSDFNSTFNSSVIIPFYVGALFSLLCGALIARNVFRQRPGESVSSGFSAMFTNTVLIGIPVISRAYGPGALPTVFSIIAFHAPTLITLGMLIMELVRRDGEPLGRTLLTALLRIIQNPLLWGVVIGALGNRLQVKLPEPGTAFLTMMSAAVLPASLFGLGGALNEYKLSESWAQASINSLFKLVIHPAIVYVLSVLILHVPIEYARYAVLLAAMPAGINVYVFATYYDRAVNVAANVVLISTVASIATITFWLYVLGH